MTAVMTAKLDSRKRLNLAKIFPNASEVRVTHEGNRIVVEPCINLTADELKAMTNPEVQAAVARIINRNPHDTSNRISKEEFEARRS